MKKQRKETKRKQTKKIHLNMKNEARLKFIGTEKKIKRQQVKKKITAKNVNKRQHSLNSFKNATTFDGN